MFLIAGVEGLVDQAVLKRILAVTGISCQRIKDYGGCANLDADIPKFLQMTRSHAVCVLRDLDKEECAPSMLRRFGVESAAVPSNIVFRVPVRQIEAWLLADADAFAKRFKVSNAQLPRSPDELDDAKDEVLRLVRRSTSPSIKEGMLPREGYARKTGPEYAGLLAEFAEQAWEPERARTASQSLDRSLKAFESFKARGVFR